MKRRTLLKSISALFLPLWANGTIAQETDHPIIKFCEDNNMLRSYLGYPNMTDPKPEFYPIQRKILNNIMKYDKSHIMACRQIGMSTMSNCVLVYTAMTKPNTKCLFIGNKQDQAKHTILSVWKMIPRELLSDLPEHRGHKNKIFFKNGSQIHFNSMTMFFAESCRDKPEFENNIYDTVIIDNPDNFICPSWNWSDFIITKTTPKKSIVCGTPLSKNGHMCSHYNPSNPAHMKVTWKDMPQRRLANINRLKQVFRPEEWETEFECNPSV